MKVLFIVTAYPRHEGDIITPWMGETISRLRAAGTDVEVLAPSYKGGGAIQIDGVKVHRFRYAPSRMETLTHDMPAVERIKRSPAFAALLPSYIAAGSEAAARVAREGRFDVVHAFWPIPHGIFGVAARNASSSALVSTFFSAELMWKGPLRTAFAPILRRIIRNSDAITVISSYTRERLHEYEAGVDTVTIPFGAAAKNQGSTTPSHRSATDPFELLFVGRLVKRKGVNVLLNAVKLLEGDRRLHLRIVGGGPELGELQQLATALGITDKVTFDGVVTNERIAELFRQCDALVLPAIVTETGDTEGLGVVLIEAMGYGKPVIASAAGGIVDIVKDNDTGLLVPPGDAAALASAIRRAMDDPDEMTRLAARGTTFADQAFGWPAIVGQLMSVYESAVKRRAAGEIETGAKQ
ncbi:MAG TPA: glycosyltransferase family 4 protein [Gemmatimonadaceae bacterium]|jgi:glycosyltransferase involved in cell wall biosynthesis|nr:glycosyltransferase family 4 protein [Gemmatimonadaceae bacterium]